MPAQHGDQTPHRLSEITEPIQLLVEGNIIRAA